MTSPGRLTVTTILGIIAGLCTWWWMGAIPAAEVWTIILSRALLGFGIGLSAWRTHWAVHGLILGIIYSLPGAAAGAWYFGTAAAFWGWIFSGIICGFLIELFASPIFHASTRRIPVTPQPHMP